MIIALAFTESSLNYNVKHKGDRAKGICGIIPEYHKDLLDSKSIDLNSIQACEEVLNYYLYIHKGNLVKALVDYKGVKSKDNMNLVYKVLEIKEKIK